jgi:hypothetical protein
MWRWTICGVEAVGEPSATRNTTQDTMGLGALHLADARVELVRRSSGTLQPSVPSRSYGLTVWSATKLMNDDAVGIERAMRDVLDGRNGDDVTSRGDEY